MNRFKKFMCACGIMILVGVVAAVAGAASGGISELKKVDERFTFMSLGYETLMTESYTFDSASAINIDYDYGDIRIVQGDEFRVDVKYSDEAPKPVVEMQGEVLSISQSGQKVPTVINFNIFGHMTEHPEIVVTCPKKTNLSELKITSMDDIYVAGIKAQKAKLNSDLGNINANNLEFAEGVITNDSGDINLMRLNAGNMEVYAENGDIVLEGNIMGKNKISAVYGDIEAALGDSVENYNLNTDIAFGDLEINEMEYETGKGFNGIYNFNGSTATKTLSIECDGGDVELKFAM